MNASDVLSWMRFSINGNSLFDFKDRAIATFFICQKYEQNTVSNYMLIYTRCIITPSVSYSFKSIASSTIIASKSLISAYLNGPVLPNLV